MTARASRRRLLIGALVLVVVAVLALAVSIAPLLEPAARDVAGRPLMDLDPQAVIEAGRLAPIPADAVDVRAQHWTGIFTGQSYLRFRTSPDGIRRFLEGSNALRSTSGKRSCTALPSPSADPAYTPAWFTPARAAQRRCYEIPPNGNGHNWGSVVVDDLESVVYVEVTWS